jgi:hypothetical protein
MELDVIELQGGGDVGSAPQCTVVFWHIEQTRAGSVRRGAWLAEMSYGRLGLTRSFTMYRLARHPHMEQPGLGS